MGETRLEKYKKYRQSVTEFNSINKEPRSIEDRKSSIINEKMNTSSTLPLEEVLGKIEEPSDARQRRVFTRKMIMVAVISAVGVALVAGIIIFAIFAFGGK